MRFLICFTTMMAALFSAAQDCPQPPIAVKPDVRVSVSFDAATHIYQYDYAVSNAADAVLDIDSFNVEFVSPISDIKKPAGWMCRKATNRNILHCLAVDPEPAAESGEDDGNISPGYARVKAGQTVTGFSFRSKHAPGPVRYYARGFQKLPTASSEIEAETSLAQCSQQSDYYDDASLIGTTVGPVDAIPVTVDIKPDDTNNVINPANQGVIPVAVLSTATFDATTIDPASLRLGPGQAHPKDDRGHVEDVNSDGKPDLLVQFPTQQIGARCNDTALMLTGATRTGSKVQGSDHIRTAGCKR